MAADQHAGAPGADTWRWVKEGTDTHYSEFAVMGDASTPDDVWLRRRAAAMVAGRSCLAEDLGDAWDDAVESLETLEEQLFETQSIEGMPRGEREALQARVAEAIELAARFRRHNGFPGCCPSCPHLANSAVLTTSDFVAANTQRGHACCVRGTPLVYGRGIREPDALQGVCLANSPVLDRLLAQELRVSDDQLATTGRPKPYPNSRGEVYSGWYAVYFPGFKPPWKDNHHQRAIPLCVINRIRATFQDDDAGNIKGTVLYDIDGQKVNLNP